MNITLVLLAIILGYPLGSISFARLVTRLAAPDKDVTELSVVHKGTGERTAVRSIGANAASMVLGPKLGGLIIVLDMLKVSVPMLAFRVLAPDQPYHLLVAVAGVAGHNWPIYHGFRGGRGFAPIVGGLLVVDWLGLVVTILISLLLGMVVVGSVPLAYAAWLFLIIPWMWFRTHSLIYVAYAVAVALLFLLATLPEIRTVWRYRREGKLEAYMQGMLDSSPRWRGMQRLAERLSVRRWRR